MKEYRFVWKVSLTKSGKNQRKTSLYIQLIGQQIFGNLYSLCDI